VVCLVKSFIELETKGGCWLVPVSWGSRIRGENEGIGALLKDIFVGKMELCYWERKGLRTYYWDIYR